MENQNHGPPNIRYTHCLQVFISNWILMQTTILYTNLIW